MKDVTRRTFLRYGAAGVATTIALPTIVPSRVLGAKGSVAPSNQIAIGQVGFGSAEPQRGPVCSSLRR